METTRSKPTQPAKRVSSFGLLFILVSFLALPVSAHSKDGKGLFRKKVISAAITSVTATAEHNYIHVKWVTRNQCSDGTYLIERSTDGENFEIVGLRRGIAVGRSEMEFYFVDNEPPSGPVFYRVRHFGNDNSELLSKAVTSSR